MKMNKEFRIVIVVVVIMLAGIIAISFINHINEKDNYKHTYIYELAQKISSNEMTVSNVDDLGIYATIDLMLSESALWGKMPLSEKFKAKYKNPKKIINNIDSYENISLGNAPEFSDRKAVTLLATKRDSIISMITKKSVTTEYTFEYVLDDNNQLDDLILLKEVDIDSMTAETYAVREYNG